MLCPKPPRHDRTRAREQTSTSSDVSRFQGRSTAFACLLLLAASSTWGAEYQRDEQGTPTSAIEIGSLLDALQPDEVERRLGIFSDWLRDWEVLPRVLRDSAIDLKLRTYHFELDLPAGQVARATALGSHLGLTTGSVKGWQAGLTWYGSYEISSNVNGAATRLLAQNRDDISVLGKAFVRYSNEG